jgi:hypothetical protein
MDTLAKDDLKNLSDHHGTPCLSLYMSTRLDAQTGSIQLRNLLREAERSLLSQNMRPVDVRTFLEPLEALLLDDTFWHTQNKGLAVFRADGLFETYHVQLNFPDQISVGSRFVIKPLLPLLTGDGRFYVLAISQNEIRLLEGTRYHIWEVELEHMPTSLREALKDEVIEKQVQFRTGHSGSKGGRAAFRGYGGGAEEEDKGRIVRYFRQIEHGLQDVLRNESAPLVLAGVDYLHSLYRQVNTYPHLVEGGVVGNPDTLKPTELHARAWVNVQLVFLGEQREAIDHYHQLANTTRVSDDIAEIVPAAYYGRVQTLLLDCAPAKWGSFEPETGLVTLCQEPSHGDEDLVNLAAVHALQNGGDIYALRAESVPGKGSIAAILRY